MSDKKQTILLFIKGSVISSDALVDAETAATLFGIKLRAFRYYVAKIIALHGLQQVKTGGHYKYRLESIQKVIRKCAENGEPLYKTDQGKIVGLCKPPKGDSE